MTWLIDGVDLSTLAFNVEQRSAGWKVPAKRGDNLDHPRARRRAVGPEQAVRRRQHRACPCGPSAPPRTGSSRSTRAREDPGPRQPRQVDRAVRAEPQAPRRRAGLLRGLRRAKNFFVNPSFGKTQTNDAVDLLKLHPQPERAGRGRGDGGHQLLPQPEHQPPWSGRPTRPGSTSPRPRCSTTGSGTFIAGGSAAWTRLWTPTMSTRAVLTVTPAGAQRRAPAYPLGYPRGAPWPSTGLRRGDTVTVSARSRSTPCRPAPSTPGPACIARGHHHRGRLQLPVRGLRCCSEHGEHVHRRSAQRHLHHPEHRRRLFRPAHERVSQPGRGRACGRTS
jgi:hypothetical protein